MYECVCDRARVIVAYFGHYRGRHKGPLFFMVWNRENGHVYLDLFKYAIFSNNYWNFIKIYTPI